MDQIIKISSEQSGQFSETNNVVRFQIPADGQYDLVDSYIVLNLEATGTVPHANVPANAISNFFTRFGGDNEVTNNTSFIKRIRVSSTNLGIIEEIQDANILNNMIGLYRDSLTAHNADNYKQINGRYYEEIMTSPFRDFQGASQGEMNAAETSVLNTNMSSNKTFGCNISLAKLCSIGKLRNCPVDIMGEMTIEVELILDLACVQITVIPTVASNLQLVGGAEADELNDFMQIMTNGTGAVAGVGTDIGFVTTRLWEQGDLNTCPWYVGMPIQVEVLNGIGTGQTTVAGGAVNLSTIASSYSMIASLDWNPTTKRITIKTSTRIGVADLPNGQTLGTTNDCANATAIKFLATPANQTMPTIKLPLAQLVVKKLANPVQIDSQFNILTYETEVVTQTAIQSFRHQSRLPPNCIGFFVTLPNAHPQFSSDTHLRDYRLAVNNIQLTNRPVITATGNTIDEQNRSGLHYSLLEKGFTQMGLPLNNLSEVVGSLTDVNGDYTKKVIMIAGTTQVTADTKTLDIELNSVDASISKVIIYKAIVKPIVL